MKEWMKDKLSNCVFVILTCWIRLKACLGLIKVKYGIQGHFEHKGLHLTEAFISKKRIDACEHYDNFRSDDVILMTYPKTGTHFTMEVIASIYKEVGQMKRENTLRAVSHLMESQQILHLKKGFSASTKGGRHPLASLDELPSPRIIGTHLPWNLLPPAAEQQRVKVIHCYRNPKDVVCSFYPFLKSIGILIAAGTSWKEFVEYYINGTVVYGGYFEWLRQWYPHRNNPNVLNLQFEDMKQDLRGNVKRIAEFLNIELTPEQVDNVVAANSFQRKKAEAGSKSFVYRKGKSGGWKSDITVEQNEMLDEWIKEETKDMPDLQFQCM